MIALLLLPLGVTLCLASDTNKSQESYLKKAEGEVQEWTVKLKSLQARSENSGSKTRQQLDEQVKSVNEKLDSVRKKLDHREGPPAMAALETDYPAGVWKTQCAI